MFFRTQVNPRSTPAGPLETLAYTRPATLFRYISHLWTLCFLSNWLAAKFVFANLIFQLIVNFRFPFSKLKSSISLGSWWNRHVSAHWGRELRIHARENGGFLATETHSHANPQSIDQFSRKWYPILDTHFLIPTPYTRLYCSKTILFRAAHSYIPHLWK